jgi:hypothetical protein
VIDRLLPDAQDIWVPASAGMTVLVSYFKFLAQHRRAESPHLNPTKVDEVSGSHSSSLSPPGCADMGGARCSAVPVRERAILYMFHALRVWGIILHCNRRGIANCTHPFSFALSLSKGRSSSRPVESRGRCFDNPGSSPGTNGEKGPRFAGLSQVSPFPVHPELVEGPFLFPPGGRDRTMLGQPRIESEDERGECGVEETPGTLRALPALRGRKTALSSRVGFAPNMSLSF